MSKDEQIEDILGEKRSTDRGLIAYYIKIVRSGNERLIEAMDQFGKYPSQRIRNVKDILRAQVFGESEFTLDEWGWVESPEWVDVEHIEFRTKSDKYNPNTIVIGRVANGKWSFGVTCHAGDEGYGYYLSVYCNPCDTREAAISAAIDEMRRWLSSKTQDQSESTASYAKKVIEKIDEFTAPKVEQLTMF